LAHWQAVRSAPTARERRFQKICFLAVWTFVLLWGVAGQYAMRAMRFHYAWSNQSFYATMTAYWGFYFAVFETYAVLHFRRLIVLHRQSGNEGGNSGATGAGQTMRSSLVMVAGLYLASFSALIYIAWESYDRGWAAIIAGIMVVLGTWHFLRLRGTPESAATREAIGRIAWLWGTMLLIVNLRWDVWLAAGRGAGLAEVHSLLPVWVVPSATLTLLIWIGIVVALTKPRRSTSRV